MHGASHKDLGRTLGVLAFCWLLPGGFAALAAPTVRVIRAASFVRHPVSLLPGVYQGRAAAKDPARRVFTLNLLADGTAMLSTLYIGKNEATQRGRWSQAGNLIVFTFDPAGSSQPPRPITFRYQNHDLRPLRWDTSEWGRSGPPILHFAHAAATGG